MKFGMAMAAIIATTPPTALGGTWHSRQRVGAEPVTAPALRWAGGRGPGAGLQVCAGGGCAVRRRVPALALRLVLAVVGVAVRKHLAAAAPGGAAFPRVGIH